MPSASLTLMHLLTRDQGCMTDASMMVAHAQILEVCCIDHHDLGLRQVRRARTANQPAHENALWDQARAAGDLRTAELALSSCPRCSTSHSHNEPGQKQSRRGHPPRQRAIVACWAPAPHVMRLWSIGQCPLSEFAVVPAGLSQKRAGCLMSSASPQEANG